MVAGGGASVVYSDTVADTFPACGETGGAGVVRPERGTVVA